MGPAGAGHRLEGLHAVGEAMAAGRVERLYVERRDRGASPLEELVALAQRSGIPVEIVDDVAAMAGTTSPQGVVAEARPLRLRTLEELAGASSPAAVVVLDRVEDPRNLGAVARSAWAAGMGGLVVAGRRAAPLSPAAFKAAAGALEHVGVAVVGSIGEAVRRLGKLGLWIIGLDAGAERSLFGLDLLAEPVAIVLGAEGAGLSRLVRDRCDVLCSVPMAGGVDSLNVAAAATLAVFEVTRVRAEIT